MHKVRCRQKAALSGFPDGTLQWILCFTTAFMHHFYLGFGDFERVDTAYSRALVVNFSRKGYGFRYIHSKYTGEYAHHKFECGVVIIE